MPPVGSAGPAAAFSGLSATTASVVRNNAAMDAALAGHLYVKSPIDVACWDILGQSLGAPIAALLGGAWVDAYPLYRAISQADPQKMADDVSRYRGEGYRRFQLKVGGDPDVDIQRVLACRRVLEPGDVLVADANTGWLPHQALRLVQARFATRTASPRTLYPPRAQPRRRSVPKARRRPARAQSRRAQSLPMSLPLMHRPPLLPLLALLPQAAAVLPRPRVPRYAD